MYAVGQKETVHSPVTSQSTPLSPGTSSFSALGGVALDPIFTTFVRLVSKGVACTWRWSDDHSPALSDSFHSACLWGGQRCSAKELWIFQCDVSTSSSTTPCSSAPSYLTYLEPMLTLVSQGCWVPSSSPPFLTSLLFSALQNQIQRVMHANSFIRLGESFVHRPLHTRNIQSSIPDKEKTMCSYQFSFFLAGFCVCLHVVVERKRIWPISLNDFDEKTSQANRFHHKYRPVITFPHALIGELRGWSEGSVAIQTAQQWTNLLNLDPPLDARQPTDMDSSYHIMHTELSESPSQLPALYSAAPFSPPTGTRVTIGSTTFGYPAECVLVYVPPVVATPLQHFRKKLAILTELPAALQLLELHSTGPPVLNDTLITNFWNFTPPLTLAVERQTVLPEQHSPLYGNTGFGYGSQISATNGTAGMVGSPPPSHQSVDITSQIMMSPPMLPLSSNAPIEPMHQFPPPSSQSPQPSRHHRKSGTSKKHNTDRIKSEDLTSKPVSIGVVKQSDSPQIPQTEDTLCKQKSDESPDLSKRERVVDSTIQSLDVTSPVNLQSQPRKDYSDDSIAKPGSEADLQLWISAKTSTIPSSSLGNSTQQADVVMMQDESTASPANKIPQSDPFSNQLDTLKPNPSSSMPTPTQSDLIPEQALKTAMDFTEQPSYATPSPLEPPRAPPTLFSPYASPVVPSPIKMKKKPVSSLPFKDTEYLKPPPNMTPWLPLSFQPPIPISPQQVLPISYTPMITPPNLNSELSSSVTPKQSHQLPTQCLSVLSSAFPGEIQKPHKMHDEPESEEERTPEDKVEIVSSPPKTPAVSTPGSILIPKISNDISTILSMCSTSSAMLALMLSDSKQLPVLYPPYLVQNSAPPENNPLFDVLIHFAQHSYEGLSDDPLDSIYLQLGMSHFAHKRHAYLSASHCFDPDISNMLLTEERHPGSPFDILMDPLTTSSPPSAVFNGIQMAKSLLSEALGGMEGPLLVNQFSRGGEGLEELAPALMVVGYKDECLQIHPHLVPLWEKLQFEPFSPRKNVTYYVLCPDNSAILPQIRSFFRNLSCTYETCNLGTHTPSTLFSDGLVLVAQELQNGKPAPHSHSSFSDAARNLSQKIMAQRTFSENICNVVYIVNPFLYTSSVHTLQVLCKLMMDVTSHTSSQKMNISISVQSIPILQILNEEAILPLLKEISFAVYNRARRCYSYQSEPTPILKKHTRDPNKCSIYSFFEPSVVLLPVVGTNQMNPQSQQDTNQSRPLLQYHQCPFLHDEHVLHICYMYSDDGKYIVTTVTDKIGELLETWIVVATGRPTFKALWLRCVDMMHATGYKGWAVALEKFGIIHMTEWEDWKALLYEDELTNCEDLVRSIAVVSLKFSPSLQTYSDGVDVLKNSTWVFFPAAPLEYSLDANSPVPLCSGFVISPPIPFPTPMQSGPGWPLTYMVSLIALIFPKSVEKRGNTHIALQCITRQLHALSWLTATPLFPNRCSVLPFHFVITKRASRLVTFINSSDSAVTGLGP
ncbi:Mediator of RNA polymerase II transcription subunit 13 [Pelomyxa schiedti]|nr:Mediator of RNA polymerase II transcription subunit 13 [Pelomyxa schiedti]